MRLAHLVPTAAMLPLLFMSAGCKTAPTPPDVPASLRPPADQTLYFEALATGSQNYECTQKADGTFEWLFQGPEAQLNSRRGPVIGKHYAGPTWEAADGSTVVGEVKARDPGPKPTAIPWLLLSAKSNTGNGTFSKARSIQRIDTEGGLAPSQTCSSANLRQLVKVPYTATYYFYR